jgi:hypothetical protein
MAPDLSTGPQDSSAGLPPSPSSLPPLDIARAEAIAQRFGRGPVDGKIQAHILAIEK